MVGGGVLRSSHVCWPCHCVSFCCSGRETRADCKGVEEDVDRLKEKSHQHAKHEFCWTWPVSLWVFQHNSVTARPGAWGVVNMPGAGRNKCVCNLPLTLWNLVLCSAWCRILALRPKQLNMARRLDKTIDPPTDPSAKFEKHFSIHASRYCSHMTELDTWLFYISIHPSLQT